MDPISQFLSNGASFGQALTLTGTSFYENYFGRDDDLTNGTLDFCRRHVELCNWYVMGLGQNLSNSTMLAGAGR